MREILFRGKAACGMWVQGDLIHRQIWKSKFEVIRIDDNGFDNYTDYEIATDTIGQYTGLTDKNGTKIFEGDIIKADNGRISAILVVQYGKFEPKMFYDLLEDYVRPRPKEKLYGLFAKSKRGEEMLLSECSHLIEVIGNIHDNPELVKECEGK